LKHLIQTKGYLQLHCKKREFLIRLSTLPRDYLVGISSGLLLMASDKKCFDIFSKKFAIYSSSLVKELHNFLQSQNPQTQNLLLDTFLQEIEGILQGNMKL